MSSSSSVSLPLIADVSMGLWGFTFTAFSPDSGTVDTAPELLNLTIMRSSRVDRQRLSCAINNTRCHGVCVWVCAFVCVPDHI